MRYTFGAVLVLVASCAAAKVTPDTIHVLKEVVVNENMARRRIASLHMGSEVLDLQKLLSTPQLFGEADIIKTLALMPGVRSESEGMGGFEVRGGSAYENLVMLDGMTLYNPSHLMGIFSTFNDDIMGHSVLHKGPIPANFGGAVSSVLETHMKSPDAEQFAASASIGLLSAKAMVSVPVVKEKLSVMLAARTSYVDKVMSLYPDFKDNEGDFYDLNAKVRYQPSAAHLIELTGFSARDRFAMSDLMWMRWSNNAASVNWTARASRRLRFITTAALTHYQSDMAQSLLDMSQQMKKYIHTYSLNERAIWSLSAAHSLEFGLRSEFLGVQSGEFFVNDQRMAERHSGWDNAAWALYEGSLSSRLHLSLGTRFALFRALGQPRFREFTAAVLEEAPNFACRTYTSLEPRASLKFDLSKCHNLKAGFSVTSQPLHFLRTSMSSMPFDRVAISSASVAPRRALQYSLAYTGMTPSASWDWSAEVYYKTLEHVYDYRDGYNIFSRVGLESILLPGRGRSYGLELMLRKNVCKFTGWVAYTLSKTESKIPGINLNRWYLASNDRRNDMSLVGLYQLTPSWQVSAAWCYASGHPLTAPDGKFSIDGFTCFYYSGRNNYITPPSHRLDLSATYTKQHKHYTSIWNVGVYNAYCRSNPFIITFAADPDNPNKIKATQTTLLPILPSISYTIKF